MIHGLLPVRKEKGSTSHQVVDQVRSIFKTRKVGHFGTLDPFATGVLLVAVGKVTRFFDFYIKKIKTYSGTIRFGYATTTYDEEGIPMAPDQDVDIRDFNWEKIMAVFKGKISQLPPLYSAKKVGGIPMYKLARRNISVERKPVTVEIHSLEWEALDQRHLWFRALTSAGTYIRSIAHDIGQMAGCGAYLASLQRESVGEFTLAQARSIAEIRAISANGNYLGTLLPLESLLTEYPKLIVNDNAARLVSNGGEVCGQDILAVIPAEEKEFYRVFDEEGVFLALARKKPNSRSFKPVVVL